MNGALLEVYDLCLDGGEIRAVGSRAHISWRLDVDPAVLVQRHRGGDDVVFLHSTSWRWDGVLLLTWVRCRRVDDPPHRVPVDPVDSVLDHALGHLAWLARREEPGLPQDWRDALAHRAENPAGRIDA